MNKQALNLVTTLVSFRHGDNKQKALPWLMAAMLAFLSLNASASEDELDFVETIGIP